MSALRTLGWMAWLPALAMLAVALPLAIAEDEEVAEKDKFEAEEETLEPVRLKSGAKKQLIEISVHLWGKDALDADGNPVSRTLDVDIAERPPFLENLRVLQRAPRSEGEAEDAPARFVPGRTVTFGPNESERPVRLEFDVAKTAEADAGGLASGRLVIQISSKDEAVTPPRRRLVLPLSFRPKGDVPETTDGVVQIRTRYSRKPENPGKGFMADGVIVEWKWEEPSVKNAHPFTGNAAYLRLTWAEAVPALYVRAVGRISGGIPGIKDEHAEFVQGPHMHPFMARFRGKHDFNIRFPIEKPNAGTIRIQGKLLAYDQTKIRNTRDKDRFDESNAVASLPFDATVNIPHPPVENPKPGRVTHYRHQATGSGSFRLAGVQPGRRVAKFNASGGIPYFGYISGGSGGGCSFSFRLVQQRTAPTSGTVSFMNFGRRVSVAATLVPEFKHERRVPDAKKLAEARAKLSRRHADPRQRLGWIREQHKRIKEQYWNDAGYEPGRWVDACNKWLAASEAAAVARGDPSWEGHNGRPPPADKLAEDRKFEYSRVVYQYFDSARSALELGQMELAEAWIRKGEALMPRELKDAGRIKHALATLITVYSKWAQMTFRFTGDIAAANEIARKRTVLMSRRSGKQPKPFKPPYKVDPEYR